MFAKKPPPEPNLPSLPPILRLGGSGQLEPISQQTSHDRVAQAVITQAFGERAEQITLTPDGEALVVHFFIAGEWKPTMTIPAQIAPGLGGAFKALAGLPVWEHRLALEGLIVVQYGATDYDVHMSITPTRHGEKIALRMAAA